MLTMLRPLCVMFTQSTHVICSQVCTTTANSLDVGVS